MSSRSRGSSAPTTCGMSPGSGIGSALLDRGKTALICGVAEAPAAEVSGLFGDGDDL